MYLKPSLFTLIALLILANPTNNLFSACAFIPQRQNVLGQTSPHAELTQIIPPWEASAQCPGDTHWACHYFKKVYCACFARGYPRPPKISPPRRIATTLAEAENITSVEFIAEVQPGNNNTLISLFVMRCPNGMHVECQIDPGSGMGAHCGCFANRISSWKIENNNDRDIENKVVYDEQQEEEGMENEEGDDGEIWFKEDKNLVFQHLYWHRCPAKRQWYCCFIDAEPLLNSGEVAEDIRVETRQPKHIPPRKECFCIDKNLPDPCPPE